MRKLSRLPLEKRVATYLAKKQAEVNIGVDVRRKWKAAQRTRSLKKVHDTLVRMVGIRERCMFCEDSHGVEIDHFWPIVPHIHRTFRWDNFLLVCGACNRKKGNRFEIDQNGDPLLIDPTLQDPWDDLYFDSATGQLTARFLASVESPRGVYTTNSSVLPLNCQAVAEGRKTTTRNIRRVIEQFLARAAPSPSDIVGLVDFVRDLDCCGLARWFFNRDGANEPPFSTLRQNRPNVWQVLANEFI